MKVFLDTNVWLSATIFSGLCEEILIQCAERNWLVSSELIRFEAHEVLLRKFPQIPTAPSLFDASWNVALRIPDVAQPAPDNDQRLVQAAAAAGVDYFVTGDKRVLGWKSMPNEHGIVQIVSPRDAWLKLFGAG